MEFEITIKKEDGITTEKGLIDNKKNHINNYNNSYDNHLIVYKGTTIDVVRYKPYVIGTIIYYAIIHFPTVKFTVVVIFCPNK